MLTHTQQMGTEATVFGSNVNEVQGEGTPAAKKSGLLSGRMAVTMLILFGLALSVAFPYGFGLVVFVAVIVLTGALYAVGFACYALVKDMFSKGATFGYVPASAYMTGKKIRKRITKSSSVEQKKDIS